MAKNFFKASEIVNLGNTVKIEAPKEPEEELSKVSEIEEYHGPTADDLRREAELFKAEWETEKEGMIGSSKEEASKIIEDAKNTAFAEIKESRDEAMKIKQAAEDEAENIKRDAENKAAAVIAAAEEQAASVEKANSEKGFAEGLERGFAEGRSEVERLIGRIHSVLSSAIEKRNTIIDESESQLVDLVLGISEKVVKVISENQKNVVINNVIQALRKLKTRSEVIVRVNLDDVKLTTEHIKDFMRMVDTVKSITVMEDSTVDKGGCIIETDFGEIDARISSQLSEIQNAIINIMPIKVKAETEEETI